MTIGTDMTTQQLHELVDHYRERCQRLEAVVTLAQKIAEQAKHTGCRTDVAGMHAIWLREMLQELAAAMRDLGIEETKG